MPIFKMKKVWDYCTSNKAFFLLIFILFIVSNCAQYIYVDSNSTILIMGIVLTNVILWGYGMAITRDRINNGVRLPKIMIKDVLVLGIKSFIVFVVYIIFRELSWTVYACRCIFQPLIWKTC